MTIDKFLEIVAPKLQMPVEKDHTYMYGRELKLTGYGEMGIPINDDELYKIPLPRVIQTDHARKIRLAWLRGGKLAVKTYLLKHLNPDVVEQVISVL